MNVKYFDGWIDSCKFVSSTVDIERPLFVDSPRIRMDKFGAIAIEVVSCNVEYLNQYFLIGNGGQQ